MNSPNESNDRRDDRDGDRKRKLENTPSPDDDGNQDLNETNDAPQTSPDSQPLSKKSRSGQRRGKHAPEPNYSDMVKKSMESTTRTNQACDRCKVGEFLSFSIFSHASLWFDLGG